MGRVLSSTLAKLTHHHGENGPSSHLDCGVSLSYGAVMMTTTLLGRYRGSTQEHKLHDRRTQTARTSDRHRAPLHSADRSPIPSRRATRTTYADTLVGGMRTAV